MFSLLKEKKGMNSMFILHNYSFTGRSSQKFGVSVILMPSGTDVNVSYTGFRWKIGTILSIAHWLFQGNISDTDDDRVQSMDSFALAGRQSRNGRCQYVSRAVSQLKLSGEDHSDYTRVSSKPWLLRPLRAPDKLRKLSSR